MSATIDERVVQMEFDNSKFESNVKTSLSTIDKLKQALNFKGAEKGLEEIEKRSDKVDLSEMRSGLEKAQSGFSALEIVAASALATITSKVTNAGIALAKSLSIDQVTAGWSKYEQKTTGVATLINNATSALSDQAVTMEEVNDELERLNWFTDETSYNFTDMVGNMGKLTSQNIPLQKSSVIMQGIANATAVAGQNAQAASRVMYNIAQAYGAGALKLMDWKSVENANVATAELKQTLIDSAVTLGTLQKVEEGIYQTAEGTAVTISNFSQTLQDGWATSEVMSMTFENYAKFGTRLKEVTDDVNLSATDFLNGLEAFSKGKESKAFKDWSESISEDLSEVGKTIDDIIPSLEELGSEEYALGRKSFKAAQEARTFTDAVDAIKDGVSTAWMNVFETIFGGYEKAKKLWTNFANTGYDLFAEPINQLNDGLSRILNFGATVSEKDWLGLEKEIQNSSSFKNILIDTAKEYGVAIDDMLEKEGSFEKTLGNRWLTYDILNKSMETYKGNAKVIAKETGENVDRIVSDLNSLRTVANEVLYGKWGNGSERISLLEEAGYDPKLIQMMADEINYYGYVTEDVKNKVVEYAKSIHDLSEEERKEKGISVEAYKESEKILKAIEDGDSALNSLIGTLSERTGRDLIIKSFQNIRDAITSVITPIKQALSSIFPTIDPEKVYNVLEAFERFTRSLILTEEQSKKVRNIFDKIASVINKVVGATKNAVSTISNFINRIKEWIGITSVFGSIIDFVYDKLSKLFTIIGNFISSIRTNEIFTNAIEDISKWINSIFEYSPEELLQKISEKLKSLKNSIVNIVSTIKNKGFSSAIELIKTKLNDFYEYIKDKFSPITNFFSGVWNSILSTLKEFGIDIRPIIDKIRSTFEKLKSLFSRLNLGSILSLALGGTILVGAIKTIIKVVKMFTAVTNVINAASTFLNGIGGVFKGIKNILNAIAFKEIGTGLLEVAGAIGIIAIVAFALSKIPENDLIKAGIAILYIIDALLALVLVLSLLDKIGGIDPKQAGITLLAFAGSIALIALALKIVSNIDISKNNYQAAKSIGVLLGVVVIVTAVIGALSKLVPQLSTGAFIFLTVSALILSVAKSIEKLTDMNSNRIESAGKAISKIMSAIALVIGIVGLFQVDFSMSAGVLAIAVAILVIVKAIKSIADIADNLKIQNVKKFVGIITGIFVALIALMAITKLGGANGFSGGAGVLLMVISIILILKYIQKLAEFKFTDLLPAVGIIALIGAIFTGLIAATKLAGNNPGKVGFSLLLMSFAIGIVAVVVALLSHIPWQNLRPAVAGISAIGLIFTAMLKASKNAKGATGAIIAMTVCLVAIGVMIGILSLIPEENLVGPVASLIFVMGALAILFYVIGKITNPKKCIGTIIEMIAVLAAVGLIIWGLTELITDVDKTIKIATSLSELLIVLSVVAGACALLGKVGPGTILKGVEGLGIVLLAISAIGAIALLVTKFDWIPDDYVERIDKVIGFVTKCSELVGAIIGGFITGIGVGLTDGLEEIATNLTNFSNNIQPFISVMDDVKPDTVSKVQILMDAIKALAVAGIWNDLSSIFGESGVVGIANDLDRMAGVIARLASVELDKIDNVITAVQKLASVEIKKKKGNLSELVEDFVEVATELSEAKIETIQTEGINSVCTALKAISEVHFDRTNGVWGFLAGNEDNFSKFARKFKNAAYSLKDVPKLEQNNVDNIGIICDVLNRINELHIDRTGGILGVIAGNENDFRKLGNRFKDAAESLSEIPSIPYYNVYAFIGVLERINAIEIGSTGGIVSWFTGDENEFSKIAERFKDAAIYLSKIPYVPSKYIDDAIVAFDKIKTFMTSFDGSDTDSVLYFADNLNALVTSMTGLQSQFIKVGFVLGNSFYTSLKEEFSKIVSAATSNINSAVSQIRSKRSSFYSAGSYAGQGIVSGLNDMWWACYQAGAALANAANQGFTDNLKINSPSKVMYDDAVYAGQGVVNGGLSMIPAVYNAFAKVGQAADDGFSNIISRIANAISSDIDVTPTITPVLDLSEIQNGSKYIDKLFGNSSVSFDGTINRARTAYTSSNIPISVDRQAQPSTGVVNNFVQNNYSPKALSRIEIYRQTKNLITAKVG